jgi:periplasmic copper chaperone A
MTLPRLSACVAALLLGACSPGRPEIKVRDAWALATLPGQSAAAYLTVTNGGAGADRLLSVSSPAAASATLHSSSMAGGVARMRPLADGLPVPPNATIKLEPARSHIMLTGLATPLAAGDSIGLTLRFERSGQIAVPVRIVEGAAAMPGMAH